MPDERLAELRRLAGDEYVVFRRDEYEKQVTLLEEKGVETVHRKRVQE